MTDAQYTINRLYEHRVKKQPCVIIEGKYIDALKEADIRMDINSKIIEDEEMFFVMYENDLLELISKIPLLRVKKRLSNLDDTKEFVINNAVDPKSKFMVRETKYTHGLLTHKNELSYVDTITFGNTRYITYKSPIDSSIIDRKEVLRLLRDSERIYCGHIPVRLCNLALPGEKYVYGGDKHHFASESGILITRDSYTSLSYFTIDKNKARRIIASKERQRNKKSSVKDRRTGYPTVEIIKRRVKTLKESLSYYIASVLNTTGYSVLTPSNFFDASKIATDIAFLAEILDLKKVASNIQAQNEGRVNHLIGAMKAVLHTDIIGKIDYDITSAREKLLKCKSEEKKIRLLSLISDRETMKKSFSRMQIEVKRLYDMYETIEKEEELQWRLPLFQEQK